MTSVGSANTGYIDRVAYEGKSAYSLMKLAKYFEDPEHYAQVSMGQLKEQTGQQNYITGGKEYSARTFESQIVGTRQNSGHGIVT